MPPRNIQFANEEFYHLVKKGVEEREIFLDEEDNLRFMNSLLVFNDKEPTPWNMRAFWEQRDPTSLINYMPEKPLIEIHAFSLMKNHFHLLVRQIKEKGVVDFMQKLGGYSYYFNKKYKRVGPLFQGRFRAILVETEEQLKNTFAYIHTNPISFIEPGWKENGINNLPEAVQFLKKYKWSSYPDYLGEENFPNIINKNFFLNLFGDEDGCKKEIESWLQYKKEINDFKNIILE